MGSTKTIIVIPCYNEEGRLPVGAFIEFHQRLHSINFLLVNDGSTDRTLSVLQEIKRRARDSFEVLDLEPNRGKAEAVRAGMQAAFKKSPTYAGYWDADLATPLREIPRFIRILDRNPTREMAFGARVQLLGRSIQRSAGRHYAGRLFATMTSLLLRLRIYDTQCGAKLFRVSDQLVSLFEAPFCTHWVFDVEIIARLIQQRRGTTLPGAEEAICEIPLKQWHDVPGSKVRPRDFVIAGWELLRIQRRYLAGE